MVYCFDRRSGLRTLTCDPCDTLTFPREPTAIVFIFCLFGQKGTILTRDSALECRRVHILLGDRATDFYLAAVASRRQE